MNGRELLWFVYAALPGAFLADFLFFMVATWWSHKLVQSKQRRRDESQG